MYKLKRIGCPCSKCKGGKMLVIANVKEHLIHHGREPIFKV